MSTRKADAKAKGLGKCSQEGCNNHAYYVESRLCLACYAFHHYWKGRSVTDKVRHAKKLEFWDKRSRDVLLVPNKVSTLKRKTG